MMMEVSRVQSSIRSAKTEADTPRSVMSSGPGGPENLVYNRYRCSHAGALAHRDVVAASRLPAFAAGPVEHLDLMGVGVAPRTEPGRVLAVEALAERVDGEVPSLGARASIGGLMQDGPRALGRGSLVVLPAACGHRGDHHCTQGSAGSEQRPSVGGKVEHRHLAYPSGAPSSAWVSSASLCPIASQACLPSPASTSSPSPPRTPLAPPRSTATRSASRSPRTTIDKPFSEFDLGGTTLSIWDPTSVGREFLANTNTVAPHTDDVAAMRALLEDRGVTFSGETIDTGVCHMAIFADPDGNPLMLHGRYVPRDCAVRRGAG